MAMVTSVVMLLLVSGAAAHSGNDLGQPDPNVACSSFDHRECNANAQHCVSHLVSNECVNNKGDRSMFNCSALDGDKKACKDAPNCDSRAGQHTCVNHDGCAHRSHRIDCLASYQCFWNGRRESDVPCEPYQEYVSCGSIDDSALCAVNPRCFYDSQWKTCRGSEESDSSGRTSADNVAGVQRYRGDTCMGKQKKQCLSDPMCMYAHSESYSNPTRGGRNLLISPTTPTPTPTETDLPNPNWESQRDPEKLKSSVKCVSRPAAERAEYLDQERPTDMACGDMFTQSDCHGHRSGCQWDECLTTEVLEPACHVKTCCGEDIVPHNECGLTVVKGTTEGSRWYSDSCDTMEVPFNDWVFVADSCFKWGGTYLLCTCGTLGKDLLECTMYTDAACTAIRASGNSETPYETNTRDNGCGNTVYAITQAATEITPPNLDSDSMTWSYTFEKPCSEWNSVIYEKDL